MNTISKKLFYLKYKELSKFNLDDEIIDSLVNNSIFKDNYKSIIVPFLNNMKPSNKNLIIEIIKTIPNFNNLNDMIKFLEIIKSKKDNFNYVNFSEKNINLTIILDKNFDSISNKLSNNHFPFSKIFDENITNIMLFGKSTELLENYDILFSIKDDSKINMELVNFIDSNPQIKDYIKNNKVEMDIFADVIQNNCVDGFLYAMQHIPRVNDIIENWNTFSEERKNNFLKICNIEYFNNLGIETVDKIIYEIDTSTSADIIFKIYDVGNYELIKDIIKYAHSEFDVVKDKIDQNIYELASCFSPKLNINDLYLQKNLNIDKASDLKEVLNRINKIQVSNNFLDKYKVIIDYLNYVVNGSYDDLKQVNLKFDKAQVEYVKNNLNSFVEDAYVEERQVFTDDLKIRFEKFNKNLLNKDLADDNGNPILSKSGKNIKVYEMNEPPFTMLIHCVNEKEKDNGNWEIARKLLDDPSTWNTQQFGNYHISCSLITNTNMSIFDFSGRKVIYGFKNISSNLIRDTYMGDHATQMIFSKYSYEKPKTNIYQIDELCKTWNTLTKTKYNEITVDRVDPVTNEKVQPDYIICFDKIDSLSIKHAQYFEIPIYVINTRVYEEQFEKLKEMKLNDTQLEEEQTNKKHI